MFRALSTGPGSRIVLPDLFVATPHGVLFACIQELMHAIKLAIGYSDQLSVVTVDGICEQCDEHGPAKLYYFCWHGR